MITRISIDISMLTSVEQESIRNDLFVNGQRVWDYDRHRSWNEPRLTKQDLDLAEKTLTYLNKERHNV